VRFPWAGSGHGPLPALLVALTVVSGVVDAVSYIALGHVFVANMTGNVVFVGFALAGAPGLSVASSLAALAAFLLGALAGGRVAARTAAHRGRDLATAGGVSSGLVLGAIGVVAALGQPLPSEGRYTLIAMLALAMGMQNATARRLAVPDLTTTVVTLTLTGLAADSHLAGGSGGWPGRRLVAVGAMFTGALAGALLLIHVDLLAALGLAAVLTTAAAIAAHVLSEDDSDWARLPARSAPPAVTRAQG
jgi:uncharacterized membrane protein YoaK (UPF0700 family)